MEQHEEKQVLDALKAIILEKIGPCRPGHVSKRLMRCGKPKCKCISKYHMHGPYYYHNSLRKNGKRRTISIPDNMVDQYLEWERNYKLVRRLFMEIIQAGFVQTTMMALPSKVTQPNEAEAFFDSLLDDE